MNANRRKEIAALVEQLQGVAEHLGALKDAVESIKDDEEAYLEAMPESLAESERHSRAEAAVEALQEVYDALDELDVDDLVSKLEAAAE